MYSIYADDICIFNDAFTLDDGIVLNPKLKLEDNTAGTLELALPMTNRAYDYIIRMMTDMSVRKDGVEVWAGRVLSDSFDFWKNRSLYCEGALAFLNDTTQPRAEYHDISVEDFLRTLLDVHNSKVSAGRQILLGDVTVTDPDDTSYRYTNYETTLECVNTMLVDKLGGHLRMRYENGKRYLDYLVDYPNTTTQTIEFGKNLFDFTSKNDMSNYATVLLPLGSRLDQSDISAIDDYTTVKSVNGGSLYVVSPEAVESYGWIEKVVKWDNVEIPSVLLERAQEYLSDIQFDNLELELNAVDLHYLSADYEDVKLLDKIRVFSVPHGLDRVFPVKKLEIPLDNPENAVFTVGETPKAPAVTSSIVAAAKKAEDTEEELSARITCTDESISEEVERATGAEVELTSRIDKTDESITLEVARATEAEGALSSSINVTATEIRSEVEDTEKELRSTISQTASEIRSEVEDTDKELRSTISQTASGIRSDVEDIEKDLRSSISQTASEIRSDVEDVESSLRSSISQTASDIRSEVEDTESDLRTTITQTVNGITLSASTSGRSTTLTLTNGRTQIDSETITFNGLVEFGDLKDGKTTISGSNITTGTIDASKVTVKNLSASNITSGTMSANRISGGSIDANDITITNLNASNITSGSLSATRVKVGSTTLVSNGKITASLLDVDTIVADVISVVDSESSAFRGLHVDTLYARNIGNEKYYTGTAYITTLYTASGTVNKSNREAKHSIEPVAQKYYDMLDLLEPVTYILNDGTSGRAHVGLIAQDVESAMVRCGISSGEFGGFVRETNGECGLRYSEFIGILIGKTQILEARLKQLENKINV